MTNHKDPITAIRHELEELRRELALKNFIFESGVEPVFILNSDATVFGMNKGASTTFGYPRDALVGKVFANEIITPTNQENFRIRFEQLLKTASEASLGQRIELTAIRSDRTEIPIELSMRVVRIQERAYFITTIGDIEKTRKAGDARNDFVSMVSHNLKNPLSAILLNAAYIRREIAQEQKLSEKELRFSKQIETMEHSAQRMNVLIDNFLDLARIESGSLTLHRQSYRVTTLINDAIEESRIFASLKSIKISKKIDITSETGYFDRARIYQVLYNLVENAVKLSPESSEIKIQVRQLDEGLLFSISDNGPGLPEQQTPSPPGLDVAKGIVEAHGGRSWLESKAGQGSTFFFSLPHPMN